MSTNSPVTPGPVASSPDELEHELARTGLCAIRVLGTSMRPTLVDGDIVLVERAGPGEVGFGDVVAVRTAAEEGGRLIVHRLLRRGPAAGGEFRMVLKGDGISALDRYGGRPGDRLIGRVRAAWRGARAIPGVTGLGARVRALLSLLAIPIQRARGH